MKALALVALCACDPLVHVGGGPAPVSSHPQLDVLLVVDDGPGARRVQSYLTDGFPYFLYGLRSARQELPDLRIGIVTTSMGAGAFSDALADCAAPTGGRFVGGWFDAYGPDADPTRDFTSRVALGENGCRFRQPLSSAAAAIVENADFLREEAYLAVVFATDSDDCSVPSGSGLFDPALERFGPLTSFRCAAAGVECGGQPLPLLPTGPLSNCAPAEITQDPAYGLVPARWYREWFQTLKRQPSRFMAVAFTDMIDPMTLSIDPGPNLTPACHLPDGSTWQPQVRLAAATGMHVPVCDGYGYEMMSALGYMLGTWMYQPPHVD